MTVRVYEIRFTRSRWANFGITGLLWLATLDVLSFYIY